MAESGRSPDRKRFTHIGLCVSDLERSLSFYCDALGFKEVARRLTVTDEGSARLLGFPSMDLELVYLERDGIRIELLWYRDPWYETGDAPRPMNRIGITHLAFRVSDLDAACERIEERGGQVLHDTTAVFPRGNRGVMALDPDGVRLELIESAGPQA